MRPITDRQKDFLDFIIKFKNDNGYSPTFREIGDGLSVTSAAALDNVNALMKKGYLHCSRNISRSIIILKLSE